ncbi:MAG: response regulator transcription factor [Lachnospiraceae bacterium]|jgi:two-component system alkaline phosphatase synthesis response regulator PhoP|nr:response regulator transcription factor [Lachnospiraceae bacterium]MCX4315317.1 response regulator transcription factor [Lachnospiraceae bacterium]
MQTIYVVEDDKNIREIESFALKNSGYTIFDFECAKDFYKKLAERKPDLILLDIMLPDEDGLEIVRRLRSTPETRKIPIILVTAKDSEIDKVKGLDIGADDYMTKPFGIMELISRVKALLRRSQETGEEVRLQVGEIVLDEERHSVSVGEVLCELTYKEYELLKFFMINEGIVLRRDVIMDRVWGTDFEGESRTLDMHIKTLRQKLREAGSLIKTVRNVGYQLEKRV